MENDSAYFRTKYKWFLLIIFFFATYRCWGAPFLWLYESVFSLSAILIIFMAYLLCTNNFVFRRIDIVLSLGMVTSVIISALLTNGGIGSVYNIICSVIYICLFKNLRFTNRERSFFLKLLEIFHIYFLIYVIVAERTEGYIGNYNANTIAMTALFNSIVFNSISNGNYPKLFILNTITIFVIVYSKSRTSLVVYIILIVLLVLSCKVHLHKKVIKSSFYAMTILGIGIPYLYVYLNNNKNTLIVQSLQQLSVQYFNKDFFTGRERMWEVAIKQINDSISNLFFGIGSHFGYEANVTLEANFHNSFFTILICSGLVGYVLFIMILSRLFFCILNLDTKLSQKICIAYIAVMIVGTFESVIFSGNFAIMSFLLLAFGRQEKIVQITPVFNKRYTNEK